MVLNKAPATVKTSVSSTEKLQRPMQKQKNSNSSNFHLKQKKHSKLKDLAVKSNSSFVTKKKVVTLKKIAKKEAEISKNETGTSKISLNPSLQIDQISKETMNKIKDLITKMRAELKTLKNQSSGNSQSKHAAVQYVVSKIKQEIKLRTKSLKAAQGLEKKTQKPQNKKSSLSSSNSVVISPTTKAIKVSTPLKFKRSKKSVPKKETTDKTLKKKKDQSKSEKSENIIQKESSSDKDINVACDEIQSSLLDYYLHYGQFNKSKKYVFPFSNGITAETKNALIKNGVIVDPNYRRKKCFITYNKNALSRRQTYEINLPPPNKYMKKSEPPRSEANLDANTSVVISKLKEVVDTMDTTYNHFANKFSNDLSQHGVGLYSNLYTNLKPNSSFGLYSTSNKTLFTSQTIGCSKETQDEAISYSDSSNNQNATLSRNSAVFNPTCLFSFEVSDSQLNQEKFVVSIEHRENLNKEYNIDDISISIRSSCLTQSKSLRQFFDELNVTSSKAIGTDSDADDQSIESFPTDSVDSKSGTTDLQMIRESQNHNDQIPMVKSSVKLLEHDLSTEKINNFDEKSNDVNIASSLIKIKSETENQMCESQVKQCLTMDSGLCIKSKSSLEISRYNISCSPTSSVQLQINSFSNNSSIVEKASRVLTRLCCQENVAKENRPKSASVANENSNHVLISLHTDSWMSMIRLNKPNSSREKRKPKSKKSISMHCSTENMTSTLVKKQSKQKKTKAIESNLEKKRKGVKSAPCGKVSSSLETVINNTNHIFEQMSLMENWRVTECLEAQSVPSIASTKTSFFNSNDSAHSLVNVEDEESFVNMHVLNDSESAALLNRSDDKVDELQKEIESLNELNSINDSLDDAPIDERIISDRIFMDEIQTLEKKLEMDEKNLCLLDGVKNDVIQIANDHLNSAQELIIDVLTIDKTIRQNDEFINKLHKFEIFSFESDQNLPNQDTKNNMQQSCKEQKIDALDSNYEFVNRYSNDFALIEYYTNKYTSSYGLDKVNDIKPIENQTQTDHENEVEQKAENTEPIFGQQILTFCNNNTDNTLQNYYLIENYLLHLCLTKIFYDFFHNNPYVDGLIYSETKSNEVTSPKFSIVDLEDSHRKTSCLENHNETQNQTSSFKELKKNSLQKIGKKVSSQKFKSRIPVRVNSSIVESKATKSIEISAL